VLGIGNAVGQQKTFKELLVGTWALDSVYDESTDGKKTNPWGPGVKGLAMWDGNGRYSWQMMSADRSKAASDNPRNPVGQAIAHFGTHCRRCGKDPDQPH
jgi:Lipocalin-like domain